MLLTLNSIKSPKPLSPNNSTETEPADAAAISILPANPLIEKDQYGQYLNFDISIKNTSDHTLDLNAIEVSVMDASAKLVVKKIINSNGLLPGIKTLGNTIIKPGETISIFNPFHSIAPDIKIAFLKYGFYFSYSDSPQQAENNRHRLPMDFDAAVEKVITPRVFVPKTNLNLPLKGKLLVWDGHDFYSHHRRFPVGLPERQAKGITANSNRYASDLVNIDEKGNMYHDDPFKKENWYVFGKIVYAPAGGIVVEVQNTIPDNEFNGKTIKSPNIPKEADPLGMGNHVIIDHGNGEFSVLLHMERGSVIVRAGELVKPGQKIGNIGFSGDAIFPHLHYAVMNGAKVLVSEGVPSYFNDFRLYRGNSIIPVKKGRIDSGDIIESEK